jgi:hypothetical protein
MMARDAPGPEDLVRPVPVAWPVWIGLLGAPSAWAAHFMVCYGLMEVGCAAGWDGFVVAGLNGVAAAVLLATLLTAPAIVASGLVAHRLSPRGRDGANDHVRQAGLFLSGLFLLAIIFETVSVLVLQPCGG